MQCVLFLCYTSHIMRIPSHSTHTINDTEFMTDITLKRYPPNNNNLYPSTVLTLYMCLFMEARSKQGESLIT